MIKHRTKNYSINMHNMIRIATSFFCAWGDSLKLPFAKLIQPYWVRRWRFATTSAFFFLPWAWIFPPILRWRGRRKTHYMAPQPFHRKNSSKQFETAEKEHPKSAKRHFIGYNSFSNPHNLENWIWHEHAKPTDCYSEVLNVAWNIHIHFFLI